MYKAQDDENHLPPKGLCMMHSSAGCCAWTSRNCV